MKQAMLLVRFLFSTRLTSILFIVFCVAMAVGTFVESFHNTATARIWVYNAWWFEAIMGVFVINFIGNIKKYRLLRWEKYQPNGRVRYRPDGNRAKISNAYGL